MSVTDTVHTLAAVAARHRPRPLSDVSPGEAIGTVVLLILVANMAVAGVLGWVWWRDRDQPAGNPARRHRRERR